MVECLLNIWKESYNPYTQMQTLPSKLGCTLVYCRKTKLTFDGCPHDKVHPPKIFPLVVKAKRSELIHPCKRSWKRKLVILYRANTCSCKRANTCLCKFSASKSFRFRYKGQCPHDKRCFHNVASQCVHAQRQRPTKTIVQLARTFCIHQSLLLTMQSHQAAPVVPSDITSNNDHCCSWQLIETADRTTQHRNHN